MRLHTSKRLTDLVLGLPFFWNIKIRLSEAVIHLDLRLTGRDDGIVKIYGKFPEGIIDICLAEIIGVQMVYVCRLS